MARKALVTFDFPSAPTVGGASTWYVTPTGTNASGTWGISVTGNAGTVTNGVYTTGNQTIGGTKTFSSTISGSVSGNAGTATTLQTARTINAVTFNGSADITVPRIRALDDRIDLFLRRPAHLDQIGQRNTGDRGVADRRDHVVAVAAEHKRGDVFNRDVELFGKEPAEAS